MKINRQFKENFTAIGFFVLSVSVLAVSLVTVLSASQLANTTLGILLAVVLSALLAAVVLAGLYQIVVIIIRARAERGGQPPTAKPEKPGIDANKSE